MRTLGFFTLTLALSACVVPKIVADNPEADTGKDTEEPDTDPGVSEGPGDEETGKPVTSAPDATTGDVSTTAATADTGSPFDMGTPPLADCEDLTVEACEANPGCMPVFGEAQEFGGCTPGQQYLGCLPQMSCDSVILTVCDAESGAPFLLSDGCIPAGFVPCDDGGEPCAGQDECAGLGPDECVDAGCTPVAGAPHVVVDGVTCADYGVHEFLGCLPPDTTCPPFVPVVCKEGEDQPAWDSPSGCVPPGFTSCDPPESVPACE